MEQFSKLKFKDKDFEMDVNLSKVDNSIWLNQKELALFYNRSKKSISTWITRIINEGILTASTVTDLETVQTESDKMVKRKIKFYNLDMIVAIGVKIGSNRGLLLKELFERNLKQTVSTNNEKIIIYNKGALNIAVFVSPEEETVYMGQSDMAALFETTQQNISKHIRHIFEEGEIGENSVSKDFLHTDSVHNFWLYTASDGKQYEVLKYNLDMILAVGYRVKSKAAIEFRRWASRVIKNYMIKGYAINEERCLQHNSILLDLQQRVVSMENNQRKQITYFKGDQLRGFIEIKRFLETAENEILIIDNYFGHEFDEVLEKLNVKKTIITNPMNKKSESNENYQVIKTDEFHDRFIFVDDVCYFSGASFKDLGSHESIMMRLHDFSIKDAFNKIKK